MQNILSTTRSPNYSILYVDDDTVACKHFSRMIGSDHNVRTANSVSEALTALDADGQDIAIVVTDFRMPILDGGDLLRELTRKFPQIVNVLVTAHADRDVLLKTVNAGEVFRVIEKPLRLSDLSETLRLAFEHYHERAMSRQQLRAMDDTLAFLVHELNTPLSAISLTAEGIEASLPDKQHLCPDDDFGQAIISMRQNAQYSLAVIKSFWHSIRTSGERLPRSAASSKASAGELITGLVDTYPFSGRQREWVHVQIHGDFVIHKQVSCVALVLSSLLANSLRAVAEITSPSLSFVVMSQPHLGIRICDNGPGIPPAIAERLLVEQVTSRADGHGLGMLFCKRVMQSLAGRIVIDSAPGVGTTVTLVFPDRE
jgi:two-component system, response regulator PhcR